MQNVVFYNRKCFWGPRKVTSLARRVAVCVFILGSFSDHSRIMLGSCSDHGRIGPALEMTFHLFLEIFFDDLAVSFFVAGAIFGEVG